MTCWTQINDRDELPFPVEVDFDEWYLQHPYHFVGAAPLAFQLIRPDLHRDC